MPRLMLYVLHAWAGLATSPMFVACYRVPCNRLILPQLTQHLHALWLASHILRPKHQAHHVMCLLLICSCWIKCCIIIYIYPFPEDSTFLQFCSINVPFHISVIILKGFTAISFVMPVCPHGITRLPLDVFSCNLIFEYFSKMCLENSNFNKVWQVLLVLFMTTNLHFWSISLNSS
jgi:hypothetical protein